MHPGAGCQQNPFLPRKAQSARDGSQLSRTSGQIQRKMAVCGGWVVVVVVFMMPSWRKVSTQPGLIPGATAWLLSL